MTKHKHESPSYVLSVLREYAKKSNRKGSYNLREMVQHENSMSFLIGQVHCNLTLNGPIREDYYPSRLEVKLEENAPKSRPFTLKIERSKHKRVSENSHPAFDNYIDAIGKFASNYSEDLK